ncbi:MAG: helix-turn-helix domain-containing protein, partial [Verrucomicrobia bacterium]|nr:helix-turn-helix domain-containing protein [Verrucomicrobiota bacterium]
MYLEEGFSQAAITAELGLGMHTVAYWDQRYQALGEQGLRHAVCPVGSSGPHATL